MHVINQLLLLVHISCYCDCVNGLSVFKPFADIFRMPNAVVKVGLTDVYVIELDWTPLAGMPVQTMMLSPVLYL